MARRGRSTKTIYDKMADIDEFFLKETADMSVADLDAKMLELAKEEERIKEAKEADEDLKQLQLAARVAAQTYTEPLKINRLKRKVIVDILNSRQS